VVFADPENQIVGTTVEEDIAFGLGNLCVPPEEMRRRIHEVLDVVGLRKYALREPHRLSGGEQQKLCLASVLAMRPECLILDSPLTFLDSTSRKEILTLLHMLHVDGSTLLYCTSDPEELLVADRIFLLSKGQLIKECTPQNLWKAPAFLNQIEIMPPPLMFFQEVFS
jgi:energy-coupling factor transporter ATP-binding protein EcfA2